MPLAEDHSKYFKLNVTGLPHHYTGSEASLVTLACFCVSGLDLLNLLGSYEESWPAWIDWIYSLQITGGPAARNAVGGFRGGPYMGSPFNPKGSASLNAEYDLPHLAMTYTALISLLILKDDLSRVNRQGILDLVSKCQQDDGSFSPFPGSKECDMRFLYCACSISYILNDWSAINKEKALNFIKKSQSYDGGFGLAPHLESHGASTYCVVAALYLLEFLDKIEKDRLLYWLVSRQNEGFHGRLNKPDDTCYGYWIGGALDILGQKDLINKKDLESFLQKTKSKVGGYGKVPQNYPDIMHSYMGIAALSIIGSSETKPFFSALGCSQSASSTLTNTNVHNKQ